MMARVPCFARVLTGVCQWTSCRTIAGIAEAVDGGAFRGNMGAMGMGQPQPRQARKEGDVRSVYLQE